MKVLCSLKVASDIPDDKTRQDKKPLFIHDQKRLLSFHSPELKRLFPPTIFITLRLTLECIFDHLDVRHSHLFPSMLR